MSTASDWMKGVGRGIKKRGTKGALRRHYGVAEGDTIPTSRLRADAARLSKKAEKGKLTEAERTLSRRINLALRYRGK